MPKGQAAYWSEEGLEIYDIGKDSAKCIFSGAVASFKPAKRLLTRRCLVIGRSNFIRLRKRYPPAKIEKLRRVVALEAPDLFPISNPELYCRIYETYESHVLLDIWAWEKEPVDRLRTVFPFRYAIPEDLAFLSRPPAIHVYRTRSMIHAVACGSGKFYDGVSWLFSEFSLEDLEKFRIGLAGSTSVIEELRVYGNALPELRDSSARPEIINIYETSLPPALEALFRSDLSLRQFRTGERALFLSDSSTLFRFAVYAAAAYGLSLFLTVTNYDSALKESRIFSRDIDKEIALTESKRIPEGNDQEMLRQFQEKIRSDLSPLNVFAVLAAGLPEGSYLKSISINNSVVEAAILSREPLVAIKKLEGNRSIGRLTLKGSPTKETTGTYAFSLLLEIKP